MITWLHHLVKNIKPPEKIGLNHPYMFEQNIPLIEYILIQLRNFRLFFTIATEYVFINRPRYFHITPLLRANEQMPLTIHFTRASKGA